MIYCTYFNSGYLSRGIVLIRSMLKHVPGFTLEVLCFDDETFEFLGRQKFPGVIPHRLPEFEARHPELLSVKPTRTRGEYFFTCTSCWTLDVAERNPTADMVTYLDADMRFYASPEPALHLMSGKDVMVCEHRRGFDNEPYGRFNVGWITFRLSEVGLNCLSGWKNSCIEWCYDRIEDGKFADQKYLDQWPASLGDRLVVAPRTLDLGPWGMEQGEIGMKDGTPVLGAEPIVLYHFQGLWIVTASRYEIGWFHKFSIAALLKYLYEPYIRELQSVEAEFALQSQTSRDNCNGIFHNLLTNFRLGHPYLADMKRVLQNMVNYVR